MSWGWLLWGSHLCPSLPGRTWLENTASDFPSPVLGRSLWQFVRLWTRTIEQWRPSVQEHLPAGGEARSLLYWTSWLFHAIGGLLLDILKQIHPELKVLLEAIPKIEMSDSKLSQARDDVNPVYMNHLKPSRKPFQTISELTYWGTLVYDTQLGSGRS